MRKKRISSRCVPERPSGGDGGRDHAARTRAVSQQREMSSRRERTRRAKSIPEPISALRDFDASSTSATSCGPSSRVVAADGAGQGRDARERNFASPACMMSSTFWQVISVPHRRPVAPTLGVSSKTSNRVPPTGTATTVDAAVGARTARTRDRGAAGPPRSSTGGAMTSRTCPCAAASRTPERCRAVADLVLVLVGEALRSPAALRCDRRQGHDPRPLLPHESLVALSSPAPGPIVGPAPARMRDARVRPAPPARAQLPGSQQKRRAPRGACARAMSYPNARNASLVHLHRDAVQRWPVRWRRRRAENLALA